MGSRDYGSGGRNLQYFRKVGAGRRAWGAGITEVGREICFTSVNFDSGKEELSADYGSSRRNLQYFRKRKSRGRKNSMRITEVVNKTCLTSVKSEQVGGLGEQNLRKWEEKLAILP